MCRWLRDEKLVLKLLSMSLVLSCLSLVRLCMFVVGVCRSMDLVSLSCSCDGLSLFLCRYDVMSVGSLGEIGF